MNIKHIILYIYILYILYVSISYEYIYILYILRIFNSPFEIRKIQNITVDKKKCLFIYIYIYYIYTYIYIYIYIYVISI